MISLAISYLKRAAISTVSVSKRAILSFQVGLFSIYIQKSDQVNLQDFPQKGTVKPKVDGVDVTDVASRVVNYDRKPQDTTNISEELTRTVEFNRQFEDNSEIAENHTSHVVKRSSDTVGFTEDIDYFEVIKRVTDGLAVTDDVNGAVVGDDQLVTFHKSKQDGFLLSDLFNTQNIKVLGDSFQIASQDDKSFTKSLSDSTGFSSQLSEDYYKVRSDQFNISESLGFANTFIRGFQDGGTVNDSVYNFATLKGIFDTVTATDDLNGQATLGDEQLILVAKGLSNVARFGEQKTAVLTKPRADQATVTDTGLVSVQNYAGNYFSADYVGGSRAFT